MTPQKLDSTTYLPVQNPLQIFIPTSSPGYAAFQDLTISSEQLTSDQEVANFFPVQLKAREVQLILPSQIKENQIRELEIPQIRLQPFVIFQPQQIKQETKVVTNVNLQPLAVSANTTSSPASQEVKLASNSPELIKGQVQLSDGLAYMGADSMVRVYHRDPSSDEHSEMTAVWPQKGQYEILVPKKEGYLVAELTDVHGKVIGRDEIDLSENRDSGRNFKLKPRSDVLEVEVVEGHNYLGPTTTVKNARVLNPALSLEFSRDQEQNRFTEAQFTKTSQLLVGSYSDGFTPSLSLANVGQVHQVNMYARGVVEGLRQIIKPGSANKDTLVWGRVLHQGQPIAGAKVYLLTAKDAQASYFSSYIPDQGLAATGIEGDFVFTDVQPGLHMLAVYHPTLKFPLEFIAVEAGMVSPIIVERSPLKNAVARTYSPFTRTIDPSEGASIQVNDSKKLINLSSGDWKKLKIYNSSGLMEIKTIPVEDVEATHFLWSREKEQLNVPLISTKWLSEIALKSGLTAETRQGLILGFGFSGSFDVYITEEKAQIIYLDRQGKILSAEADSKLRNGFLIVGSGFTYHQVSVVHQKTGKIASRIVLPKGDSVALVF